MGYPRRMRSIPVFLVGAACAAALIFVLAPAMARSGSASAQRKARVDSASRVLTFASQRLAQGIGEPEDVHRWSVRRLRAEVANGVAASTSRKAHLARMKVLEQQIATKVGSGAMTPRAEAAAQYYLAEAELWALGAESP